jgi:hypothetical protein
MCIASSATVYMYATVSGPTPTPVYVLGTGSITGFAVSPVTAPGFVLPGYVNDSITPITNTITFTGTTGSTGVYAINGYPLQLLNTSLVATTARQAAGCAIYRFTIATSATGTNFINGIVFTANATPATTATNLVALVNIPGWTILSASDVVTMMAITPGYMAKPVFSAGAVAVLTVSTETFIQGFTLAGYTSSWGAATAVWTGPAPVFSTVIAPTTTTWARAYTFAAALGVTYTMVDKQMNVGAKDPTLTGALTTQTYTQVAVPADLNYYLNFSKAEMHGNVNVTAIVEKFS